MMSDPEEKVIHIRIKAVDNNWVMGDDIDILMKSNETIRELANEISNEKGISPKRMSFLISPRRVISPDKWELSLSKNGIYDGTKMTIQPTFPGCWQWESRIYYVKQTLDKLIEVVEQRGLEDDDFRVTLDELSKNVLFPPPMKRDKLLPFIRQYPEIFHVEMDTVLGTTYVTINKDGKLPVWL